MDEKERDSFQQKINNLSKLFESKGLTSGMNPEHKNFDTSKLEDPNFYLELLDELEELKRQARVLFLHSVFKKLCVEEGKVYKFSYPFQAIKSYIGIFKKEEFYYLVDDNGGLGHCFYDENFQIFIDREFWELYD